MEEEEAASRRSGFELKSKNIIIGLYTRTRKFATRSSTNLNVLLFKLLLLGAMRMSFTDHVATSNGGGGIVKVDSR